MLSGVDGPPSAKASRKQGTNPCASKRRSESERAQKYFGHDIHDAIATGQQERGSPPRLASQLLPSVTPMSQRVDDGARQLPVGRPPIPSERNRTAATIASTTNNKSTTPWETTNGGSVCFGARARKAGIFRNDCTTPTNTFR